MISGALMRRPPLVAARSTQTAKPTAGIGCFEPSLVSKFIVAAARDQRAVRRRRPGSCSSKTKPV